MNLGISVNGGCAQAVVMDANGTIGARGTSTASDANDAILAAAREALAGGNGSGPSAVGLAFLDPDSKNWPSDLTFLATAVGEKVPVRTLSTGNASALAESWYGSGQGVRNLIAFSVGPCAAAGIISNGALLSGAHGLAGSIQWLALNPVEREDYRRMGCLEAEGGAAGIVRRLIWRVKSGDRSRVVDDAGGDFDAVTLDMILKGARDNDGVSISVIRDTVKYLAMAVSNIAAVVDPELIVLGGILESSGDLLLEPIRQECARRMPPGIYDNVRIEVSRLGADCAPMGAARFAQSGAQLPNGG